MEDLIIDLYQKIYNYKFMSKYLNDTDIVYSYAMYFDRIEAERCASFYLQKYKKTLSKLGTLLGGIRLVYQRNIYVKKTDEDIYNDLIFCAIGILCEAYIALGWNSSVNDFYLTYLR